MTVPGAPVLNTATAGNAQVALAWTAPSSNGGSAVEGYNVFVGTSAGGERPRRSTVDVGHRDQLHGDRAG